MGGICESLAGGGAKWGKWAQDSGGVQSNPQDAMKYVIFELERVDELWVIILKINSNFEEKMTSVFINDMRNLVNFIGALKSFKVNILRDLFVQGI